MQRWVDSRRSTVAGKVQRSGEEEMFSQSPMKHKSRKLVLILVIYS